MIANISWMAGVIYLGLLLLKLCLAIAYYRRQNSCSRSDSITSEQANEFCIVQPILSGDPKLESILWMNVQTLPKEVQFLWMIDTDDFVAREICERLRTQEPANCDRISVFDCQPAPMNKNPKTWKLQFAIEVCNRRYLVVLDDDTTIDNTCLVAAWTSLKTHALYTGLPMYRRGESIWSDLVTHFVANNSVLTYLPPLMLFEPLTINGMFYATRTDILRRLGGFAAIVNELCDDYAIKKLYSRAGERIHQGVSLQQISTSLGSFVDYHRLLHRWNLFAIQLFKDQRLVVQAVMAVFLGLPPVLLLVGLLASLFDFWSLGYFVLVLLARDALLRMGQSVLFGKKASMNSVLSVVAEFLQPFHLISASINPSIRWRHRTIRVGIDMR